MTEREPPDPTEVETEVHHSYLDVPPDGPPLWFFVLGAVVLGSIILASFYGLYTLNRASPTFTPDPARLTQAVVEATRATESPPSLDTASPPSITPTVTPAQTLTPTVEPPTFTVRSGDSLIGIASQLNVDPEALAALNGISGETIFPDQVLVVPPTITPWPETGPFPHVVSAGETLLSIATLYQVSVDEIQRLNGLSSDTIFAGQRILIPANGVRPPTPTPAPPTPTPWQGAAVTDELDLIYSLTIHDRPFTLHVPRDAQAAASNRTIEIAEMIEQALNYSRAVLQRRPPQQFDVYVADTLFGAPHTHRRAFSQPSRNRLFLLYDGSGTLTERLYFTTYAVTHLVAAQTLGEPASPLLSEGLAVHTASQALEGSYLSPKQFCTAYQATGRRLRPSDTLTFEGHLGHLDQYFTAGCFVGYLIEQGGAPAFDELYQSGDYAVYEQTLNQLELAWSASLREAIPDLPFDPQELVRVATAIDDAYRRLWADFEGTREQFAAYEWLNRAQTAILQGRLNAARGNLAAFEVMWEEQSEP